MSLTSRISDPTFPYESLTIRCTKLSIFYGPFYVRAYHPFMNSFSQPYYPNNTIGYILSKNRPTWRHILLLWLLLHGPTCPIRLFIWCNRLMTFVKASKFGWYPSILFLANCAIYMILFFIIYLPLLDFTLLSQSRFHDFY